MKQHRADFGVATHNGRLFVFGGKFDDCIDRIMKTSEVYDPETDTWQDLPPMPHKRTSSAAVTVDGKIYVMEGFVCDKYVVDPVSSVDIFNVTTWKWEKGPDMPTPCHQHAAVTIGKFIFVIGGHTHHYELLSDTLIYDVDKKKWSNSPSMTTGRYSHIAPTINGKNMVIAGSYDKSGELISNTAEATTINFGNTAR